MGNCNNCKYWGNRRHKYDMVDNKGTCSAPKIIYDWEIPLADVSDYGAAIEVDMGWGMLTGPYFGCLLYESNDNER